MKYLTNKLAQFKQWILSIVSGSYLTANDIKALQKHRVEKHKQTGEYGAVTGEKVRAFIFKADTPEEVYKWIADDFNRNYR